jgi:hypothetical protein
MYREELIYPTKRYCVVSSTYNTRDSTGEFAGLLYRKPVMTRVGLLLYYNN